MKCRPVINKAPPFEGLNIRIPIIIPIKGTGSIIQGSTLGPLDLGIAFWVIRGCQCSGLSLRYVSVEGQDFLISITKGIKALLYAGTKC